MEADLIQYTKKQIRDFRRAMDILYALGKQGAIFYCTGDTVHLMAGEPHDEDERARQERIVDSAYVPGMNAGDW